MRVLQGACWAGDSGIVLATRFGLARLFAISPTALAGAFVLGAAVAAFFGMAPVVSQQVGFTDAQTGTIVSAALIGALAFQWPLGWLSDKVDRRLIVLASSVAGVVAALLLAAALSQGNHLSVVVVTFLLGGTLLPLYSVCLAEVNDRIGEEELIAAASGFVLVYGVGSATGPLVAGLVMGWAGPSGLSWFIAAILGIFAAYGSLRIRRREKTATAEKQDYVATSSTSHAALPLHRHGPDKAEGKAAPR